VDRVIRRYAYNGLNTESRNLNVEVSGFFFEVKRLQKQIYLVRHGEVDAPAGVFLGKTDAGLCAEGREHGGWLADRLLNMPVDRCFCSPLLRAQQTASYIAEHKGLSIETHDALREIHFGRWEGRLFDEIEADEPREVQDWCLNPLSFTFPQGDSVHLFMDRVKTFFHWIRQEEGENLLLVTHGGVIRTLLFQMLKLNPEDQFKFEVARGSLSIVKLFGDEAILTRLNDHGS
jgi:alpha-ribazole phosphatase